jgi:hypothetical protein
MTKQTVTRTKMDKLYNALVVDRKELTTNQIRSRIGLVNPTSAIHKLRQEVTPGRIYLNEKNGVRKYRYWSPND